MLVIFHTSEFFQYQPRGFLFIGLVSVVMPLRKILKHNQHALLSRPKPLWYAGYVYHYGLGLESPLEVSCVWRVTGSRGHSTHKQSHPLMSSWLHVLLGGRWAWLVAIARDVAWKGEFLSPAPLFLCFLAAMRRAAALHQALSPQHWSQSSMD